MTEKEALKLSLEALKYPLNQSHENFNVDMAELLAHRAITAIKEALASHIPDATKMVAQPEQIAVCIGYWNQKTGAYYKPDQISASHQKLIEDGILRRCYTTPPQRTWVGLTDDEVEDIWNCYCDEMGEASINDAPDIARAIESALRSKNT